MLCRVSGTGSSSEVYASYPTSRQINELELNDPRLVEVLGHELRPREDSSSRLTMPNTFTSLRYHIIFATKDRKRFIEPPLREIMHAYLGGCVRTIGGIPLEIGGVSDHAHLLLGLKPNHCVEDVLRSIKKASSEWVRHEMGVGAFHWQDGYSAFTVGRKGIDDLRRYIANQAEHHQRKTFEEEYHEFLKAHGIEFDERYLL